MRLSVIVLVAALTVAVPARAQQFNPAQTAAIAQGVVGLMFGIMFPQPQCGPHDNLPEAFRLQPRPPAYGQPRPYQPTTPYYGQPQPGPQPNFSADDDDDDGQPLQPLPPRLSQRTDNRQPQAYPYENGGDPNQPAEARATDDGQSGYRPAPGDEADDQPVVTRHRSAHRHRSQQAAVQGQPQDSASQASNGQVAEIPSQAHATRAYRPAPAGQSAAPSANYDSSSDN